MGRQVTVEVAELTKIKDVSIEFFTDTYESYEDMDEENPVIYTLEFARITFPDGRQAVVDNYDDSISFDCRNKDTSANGWIEYWFIQNHVPYYEG